MVCPEVFRESTWQAKTASVRQKVREYREFTKKQGVADE